MSTYLAIMISIFSNLLFLTNLSAQLSSADSSTTQVLELEDVVNENEGDNRRLNALGNIVNLATDAFEGMKNNLVEPLSHTALDKLYHPTTLLSRNLFQDSGTYFAADNQRTMNSPGMQQLNNLLGLNQRGILSSNGLLSSNSTLYNPLSYPSVNQAGGGGLLQSLGGSGGGLSRNLGLNSVFNGNGGLLSPVRNMFGAAQPSSGGLLGGFGAAQPSSGGLLGGFGATQPSSGGLLGGIGNGSLLGGGNQLLGGMGNGNLIGTGSQLLNGVTSLAGSPEMTDFLSSLTGR